MCQKAVTGVRYCSLLSESNLLSFYPLRCPWIILIAITSLTNLNNVITLMPWVDRKLQTYPTPCSYVTCMVLGYYGAIFQLTIAVCDGTDVAPTSLRCQHGKNIFCVW